MLVTRPAHQHHVMVDGCRNLGLTPVCLPTIDIQPTEIDIDLSIIQQADLVLFTSYNAVQFAEANTPMPWPSSNIECIGPATAKAVLQHQQPLKQQPISPFTSEAYIDDLAARIKNDPNSIKQAVIIKGEGGRKLIETFFQQKNIQLTTFSVYRRLCPSLELSQSEEIFGKNCPEIITTSSDDGLKNLIHMIDKENLPTIFNSQLIVNSERSASIAKQYGFKKAALVANPPGDQGQLHALAEYINAS